MTYRDLSAFFEGANTLTLRRLADIARFNVEIHEFIEDAS
jgi:hypothetical protein